MSGHFRPEIEITTPGNPRMVALRKITAENLATLWPVETSAVTNMVAEDRAFMAGSPYELFDSLDDDPDTAIWGIYATRDDSDGEELAGIATLHPTSSPWQDLGIAILNPNLQGQGIGPRVVLALADCAFQAQECQLLFADPLETNQPMQRVLQKLGFIARPWERGKTMDLSERRALWVLPRTREAAEQAVPHFSDEQITHALATFQAARDAVNITYS